MALNADASTQLGCGRDIDQVWDHLDRGPDAHELTCPYCRAARDDLEELARATQELRAGDADDPDLQPSPAVLDRILAVARTEVRRGRLLPLDQPDRDGTTPSTVSEQAVTAVVRRVGDRTDDVQIRRCAIRAEGPGSATPGHVDPGAGTGPEPLAVAAGSGARDTGPATVTISLRVSVVHDLDIAEALQQLRRAVVAAVAQEVGVVVTAIDVNVEDVHDV